MNAARARSPSTPFPANFRVANHSASIGGFAEHQGSTTLHTAQASNPTESERKTLEAAFKSMLQGFTAGLDQFADCLAKA